MVIRPSGKGDLRDLLIAVCYESRVYRSLSQGWPFDKESIF